MTSMQNRYLPCFFFVLIDSGIFGCISNIQSKINEADGDVPASGRF